MIPKVIHFIFGLVPDFQKAPFSLVHWIAIKSAIDVHKPDMVYFHYAYEPSCALWEDIKPELTLNRITPPDMIGGGEVKHAAHKADILRLQLLYEHGGLYLDIDTISVKSVWGLDYPCVVGTEMKSTGKVMGVSNAIIMAEQGSTFINKWLNLYESWDPHSWNDHSVVLPAELARLNPHDVHVESPSSFTWPTWDPDGLKKLFIENHKFEAAYVHHLWEMNSWGKYIGRLDPIMVRTHDTTYNVLARKYL